MKKAAHFRLMVSRFIFSETIIDVGEMRYQLLPNPATTRWQDCQLRGRWL
jgi:hypothetical protein